MNRFDRQHQTLAIGLAALAGFVDATGFLSANGYFVSFMSGNTTRLGVNLARAPHVAAIPALLIAGFVTGVALGAVVATRAARWHKLAVLGLVSGLLLGAALCEETGLNTGRLAMLVLAMGALNNTFQRDGEVAIGLTYMTGALVKLGQAIGAALLGGQRTGWAAYLLLWAGMAGGAVLGAFAFSHFAAVTVWFAAGWALLMAGAAWGIEV